MQTVRNPLDSKVELLFTKQSFLMLYPLHYANKSKKVNSMEYNKL